MQTIVATTGTALILLLLKLPNICAINFFKIKIFVRRLKCGSGGFLCSGSIDRPCLVLPLPIMHFARD